MSIIDELITDRTGGYYGASDLNRVQAAVKYLADLLRGYGYSPAIAPLPDVWEITDYPTAIDADNYLGNVRALLDAVRALPATPAPPESIDDLKVKGANDIERILIDINTLIAWMPAAFRHSGTFSAGMEGLRV